MRRHHYLYGRSRYLADPIILAEISAAHREIAARQALSLGLCDPAGAGSWTHPHLGRALSADGKVVTPLFKAPLGPVENRIGPGKDACQIGLGNAF